MTDRDRLSRVGPPVPPARPGRDPVVVATSAVLVGIGLLHVAWGAGVSFPRVDSGALTDAVVGSDRRPSPAACYAVATALGAAAALVGGAPARAPRLGRVGRTGVATILGLRGVLGVVGRTDLVSPGSTSHRFRRWDRRLYAPLCLALATGAARSIRTTPGHAA
jgi:hypothetical protein